MYRPRYNEGVEATRARVSLPCGRIVPGLLDVEAGVFVYADWKAGRAITVDLVGDADRFRLVPDGAGLYGRDNVTKWS